ncbi:MAG TPA: hypothetical protein VHV51_22965 [Polyangiaceae bacterium]|jgi:hypothetical protein|nr:hypothetical protein [Polyangiaceae bacterium]
MKAEFEIKNDDVRRVVYVRMTGTFDEAAMHAWARAYRAQGTALHAGKRHMVIADMRGMKTMHPSLAAIMGAEIGYARRHGVVLCAHVSDNTVQGLQAARVARQNSASDDVTVDVDSLDEAERVVRAYAKYLDDPRFKGSIRDALDAALG